MAKKRVAVICGASIVTSTIIEEKLKQLFKEKNIEVEISKGLTLEADRLAQNADLIVATAFLRTDYGVPVVDGVPFLTGVDVEETARQILEILAK
ncbi:MAG: PTS sugar transporter subunit IIB [Chloroflexota bacterium]|nr:PTS sugar transporter subunit IIB [Chloroflexota bacterium]